MKILWFCLLPLSLCAQWKEDFSMGHLQNWKGDTNSFTITQNKMLQLSANDSGDKFIYRETSENPDTEWALYFEMKFAPSATNKLRIYLSMDQIDPISSQAYYFEIGENGSNDNWKFYAQSTNKNIILGQGELSKLSSDPSRAYILAARTIDSSWIIQCDYTGNRNFSETIILKDSLYMKFPKSYFGLQCTYTSTRADKFIFDDISVDVPFIDKESPEIIGHSILNTKTIQINWNEKIDTTSAKTISNFQIQSIGNPVRIEIVSENQMNLEFPNEFVLSKNYILTYINVRDLSGNNITAEKQYKFDAVFDQFPEQGDIIISEIMADPDPAVALPAAEYVEIFNRSNKKINLEGLRISDGGNPSSPFKKEYLDPGEFMILCSAKDSLQFKPFGRTMGISSFPVFNNDDDQIILYSNNNNILD
ncbi:MAG: lamin tail domain-containing protein, partial [Saprospiraceae bacterium]|nr:lamin tail domain-containing protein [Saprospiraceae bacterium]